MFSGASNGHNKSRRALRAKCPTWRQSYSWRAVRVAAAARFMHRSCSLCFFTCATKASLRHHRDCELIYTQEGAFSVVGRFFFLMQLYSFFHSLSLTKGETEGYVKLTAEEIAVKRSLHFSFSLTVFFLYCQCYWPLAGIWIFKRHFISLSCSYSQGKGGKSCTVFLFYPPLSLDLQMNSGQAFIFAPYASFSCLTYLFCFMPEVTPADWKAETRSRKYREHFQ